MRPRPGCAGAKGRTGAACTQRNVQSMNADSSCRFPVKRGQPSCSLRSRSSKASDKLLERFSEGFRDGNLLTLS